MGRRNQYRPRNVDSAAREGHGGKKPDYESSSIHARPSSSPGAPSVAAPPTPADHLRAALRLWEVLRVRLLGNSSPGKGGPLRTLRKTASKRLRLPRCTRAER